MIRSGTCHKRQKPQAPTPQAPIRNRQTRKVANAKGLNRNTNLTYFNLTWPNLTYTNFGVCDFSRLEVTDWRLWFLALSNAPRRTNCTKRFVKAQNGSKILHQDFTLLSPRCSMSFPLPKRHPKIYYGNDCPNISSFDGFSKVCNLITWKSLPSSSSWQKKRKIAVPIMQRLSNVQQHVKWGAWGTVRLHSQQ